MKKHKFLSIFAIMFALVFALSICFFAACGSDDDDKDNDTTVTIPEDETKEDDTTEDDSKDDDTTKDEDEEKSDDDEKKDDEKDDDDEKKEDDEKKDDDDDDGDELPSVSVAFTEDDDYSWISTTQETSDGKEAYFDVNTTTADKPYANGILSLAPTSSGMIIRTDKDAIATGGSASSTNNGRYFEIDLEGYADYYVSIAVEMSNTGDSNGDRELLLASTITSSVSNSSVLTFVSSDGEKEGHETLTYVMLITEDCPALYLTWNASIYIYSIDIAISEEGEIAEVPTGVTISADNATVDELPFEISAGYDPIYDEDVNPEPSEPVVATLTATATNSENEDFEYGGGYTWTSSDTTVVTVSGHTDTVEITVVGEGEATITVRLWEAPSVTAELKITVTGELAAYVVDVTIAWSFGSADNGLNLDDYVEATITMSDGSDYTGDYVWSSLDVAVVTCSNADSETYVGCGHVEAIGVGTAYIAVTLDDGSTWAASFELVDNPMATTALTQLGKITLTA